MRAWIKWWNRSLWWRTYEEGGFDGWRTIKGRRLTCQTMDTARRRPDLKDEIREMSFGVNLGGFTGITMPLKKSNTYDLTRTNYAFEPSGEGFYGHITCWDGGNPRPGDFVILRNEASTTRYRIVRVDPCYNVDPPTMWMADLVFDPRKENV